MEYDIKADKYKICYFKKGTDIFHREDGPALEYCNGEKYWFFDGDLHRINGPAIEYNNGYISWHINGKRLSLEKQIILSRWWKNKNDKNTM